MKTRRLVGYIDTKPGPDAYARHLCQIIREGQSPTDVNWAISEVVKLVKAAATLSPEAWATTG